MFQAVIGLKRDTFSIGKNHMCMIMFQAVIGLKRVKAPMWRLKLYRLETCVCMMLELEEHSQFKPYSRMQKLIKLQTHATRWIEDAHWARWRHPLTPPHTSPTASAKSLPHISTASPKALHSLHLELTQQNNKTKQQLPCSLNRPTTASAAATASK